MCLLVEILPVGWIYINVYSLSRVKCYKIDGDNCEVNNFVCKISLKSLNCETNRKIDWHVLVIWRFRKSAEAG